MSFVASVFAADAGRDLIQVYLADVDIYIYIDIHGQTVCVVIEWQN